MNKKEVRKSNEEAHSVLHEAMLTASGSHGEPLVLKPRLESLPTTVSLGTMLKIFKTAGAATALAVGFSLDEIKYASLAVKADHVKADSDFGSMSAYRIIFY